MDLSFNVFLIALYCALMSTSSGQRKFIESPTKPIKVKIGATASFSWKYSDNPPFLSAYFAKLDSNGRILSPYIMYKRKYSDPAFAVSQNAEYKDRAFAPSAHTIEIRRTKLSDDATYRFHVTDQEFNSLESDVRLIILESPSVSIRSSASVQATEGGVIKLECGSIRGSPRPFEFTWRFNGQVISTGKNHTRFDLIVNVTGREVKGVYGCTILNEAGSSSYTVNLDVLYRPVVTSLPTVVPVREDSRASIKCIAEGNPNIVSYSWYRDVELRTRVQEGANIKILENNQVLSFESVPRRLSGAYYCVGLNSIGFGKPGETKLDVLYPPGEVDIPSTNGVISIRAGNNLTAKCSVDSNPDATYKWLRRGYPVAGNEKTGDLILPFIQPESGGFYRCEARNLYGFKTGSVRINVQYAPRAINFTVNGVRNTFYSIKDTPANLTCIADSNPPANYLIRLRGTTESLGSVRGFYYLPKVSELNEGKYECIANNNLGSPISTVLTLLVAVKPSFINLGSNQPENVREGTDLEIDCTVKSKPAPVLYWQVNDFNLTTNDTHRSITFSHFGMQGQETIMRSRIRLNPVRKTDSGRYKCIATNLIGTESRERRVNVQYPPHLLPDGRPNNFTVAEGVSVELICKAEGNPAVNHYKWTLNGRVLNNHRGTRVYIASVTRNEAGRYTCNGVNSLGDGEVAVAYVNVRYKPVITTKPADVTVQLNARVVLTCRAVGYPEPKLYWYKNDKLVGSGDTLTLARVTRLEKGRYTCVASNKVGNTTAIGNVLVRHPPFIVSNTPSFTKVGADLNSRATLTCTVDAYPSATLRWELNNIEIVSGSNGYDIQKDGDTSYLRVQVYDASRRTRYICHAQNTLGRTSETYEILPKGPPSAPVRDSLKATDTLRQTDPPTSDVHITWIPGFNGGYSIRTLLYYRERGMSSFQELSLGTVSTPEYTIRGLKAETAYQFTIKVSNPQGVSDEYLPYLEYTTKTPPTPRATASVEQYGTAGTDVIVKWIVAKPLLALAITIKYKQVNALNFQSVKAPVSQKSYIIRGLEKGTTYEFQVLVTYTDGSVGWPVGAGKIIPGGGVTPEGRTGLSKNVIIAIVVAVGGFLILLIICVALFVFRRKNKGFSQRDPRVEFTTAGSVRSGYGGFTTGGSDVVRTTYMEEDAQMLEEKLPNSEKRNSPPPKYSDVHYYNGSLDSRTSTFQPRNPVGNTPAYSSLSRSSRRRESDRGVDVPSKAPSHTSLSSNRAAEITRTQRNPHEMEYGPRRPHNARENPQYASDGSVDNVSRGRGQRPRPGVENPRYRPDSQNFGPHGQHNPNVQVTNLDVDNRTAQYRNNGGRNVRGSSSGGPSTDENLSEHDPEGNEQMLAPLLDSTASDEDMPIPPPFLRDAVRTPSDNERVPGSMGAAADRMGRRRPPPPADRGYSDRPYYPERQAYNDGRNSPPQAPHSPESSRSGTSSRPYRSDNEYIDDGDDSQYVGYLV